jgi:hypothetical protein
VSHFVGIVGSVMRLGAALWLVWVCLQDLPAQQARDGFEALPPYDAAAEAGDLFKQDRIAEALVLVDDALAKDPANNRLLVMKQGLEIERKSWMRQIAAGGRGALTGRGTDTASAAGAIVADLFVFGDVRDLVVQSGHWLRGEETDEVIVALSAGGILLTVSPELDLGSAVIKLARRMGALSDAFARAIAEAARRAVKERSADAVAGITQDVAKLSERARPAGAIAIVKHVDDPATLRLVTQFSERPEGLRALLLDPATTVRWLKSGWPHAGEWLLKAAAKGRPGLDYLARNSSLMFKAHPLLGLVKGLWKGNIPDFLLALGREYAMVVLGFAAGWAAFESLLVMARLLGFGLSFGRKGPREPVPSG